MTDFHRQVVVLTGASSGIGAATAVEFSRRGAKVVLAARRAEELERVARNCRDAGAADCLVVQTDVARRVDCEELIRRTLEQFGTVDVLVNNAGFAIFDPIESASPDDVEAMMRTNYLGAFYCAQAALRPMLERGRGSIVVVASITGIMGFARMGGYCATKFALIGMTEALRNEVTDRGVKVSIICPGTTSTNFFVTAEKGKMPAASRLMLAMKPQRVARAIVRAAETGTYRKIVPAMAAAYMRFKELAPRPAHLLMRHVSKAIERKRD